MQKPGIFGILEYSEPFYDCILLHIHNTVIYTKIGKPCLTLEIQNPGTLAILEYSEGLTYLKSNSYSEPSQ